MKNDKNRKFSKILELIENVNVRFPVSNHIDSRARKIHISTKLCSIFEKNKFLKNVKKLVIKNVILKRMIEKRNIFIELQLYSALFYIESFTSPPGGNQVDGLPPASSRSGATSSD